MKEEMTITQMIAEEKILGKRIYDLVKGDFNLITYHLVNRPYVGARTAIEQEMYQKAKMQELCDLMKRLRAIKHAHVKANHETKVTVEEEPDLFKLMAGKELGKEEITIAEAINRKAQYKAARDERFSYEALAALLLRKYTADFNKKEEYDRAAEDYVNSNLVKMFPPESQKSWSQDKYNEQKAILTKESEVIRIDPNNVISSDVIAKYYNAINTYLLKIDTILSEANACTRVEFEY